MIQLQSTSRGVVRLFKSVMMLACCTALCALEAKAAPFVPETNTMGFENLSPVEVGNEGIVSEGVMSAAIPKFQSSIGYNVNGTMALTMDHRIIVPISGAEDTVESKTGRRTRRHANIGGKWASKHLTYKIGKYSSKLDNVTVDEEIAKAFAFWSEYTDLTFTQKRGEVDIEIRFERGDHNDGYPFEESSGAVLSHSFYPNFGGDIHFDDSQNWTANSKDGINLLSVATHEIGHALGLSHSRIDSAVMYPHRNNSYNPNFQLDSHDIAEIQALYGPKTQGSFQRVSLGSRNGRIH